MRGQAVKARESEWYFAMGLGVGLGGRRCLLLLSPILGKGRGGGDKIDVTPFSLSLFFFGGSPNREKAKITAGKERGREGGGR